MSLFRPGLIVAFAAVAVLLAGCSASGSLAAVAASPASSETPSASAPLVANPGVVAIGDSIMKGHGLTAEQAWPQLMAARNGWRLDNLACDGAGFLAVGDDADCKDTFAGLVAKAVALHPHTVIIEGSSNDFGESNDALMPETAGQLRELRKALPNAQIIGLSTVWNETAPPEQLTDIDHQMRSAVTAVGGTFVSIGQPLGGHPEWMQSDDVHPTAEGQFAIYDAVQAAFEAAHLHA